MNNELPNFSNKRKVCIICEGYEEYDYIEKLKEINVWNDKYDINSFNAEGLGNIYARYQDKYQNGSYDIVFVFCDTERKPYKVYEDIKTKINKFHGSSIAADNVVIFSNLCTMQTIILHWKNIVLKSNQKAKNSYIFKELFDIDKYKARDDQRKIIFSKVNAKNYEFMKDNVKTLSNDDKVTPSSNFDKLIDYLSSNNDDWIDEINDILLGDN